MTLEMRAIVEEAALEPGVWISVAEVLRRLRLARGRASSRQVAGILASAARAGDLETRQGAGRQTEYRLPA